MTRVPDFESEDDASSGAEVAHASALPFDRAFGIAHVMTNLLAVVAGKLEQIQDDRHFPAAAREAAAAGLVSAERAARLMRSMMATLSGEASRPGRCDSAVLFQALQASHEGPGIRPLVVANGEALPLLIDPVALTDLLSNTLDALQPETPDGAIGLACRRGVAPAGRPPGLYAELLISGGRWQAPAWQQRALGGDPREILQEFCRLAGGAFDMRPDAGHAMTISLLLPMIDEREVEQAPPVEPPRKGQVLVVEDDEPVRLHAERVIASLGYGVLSAASGEDALALLATAAPVDVLFTDVMMPGGMSGGELAEFVGRIRPEMPIVFTSGHNADPRVAKILQTDRAAMLPKPYRRNTLAGMLEAAISRCAPSHGAHP